VVHSFKFRQVANALTYYAILLLLLPLQAQLLLAQDILVSKVTNFIALRSYVFNHISNYNFFILFLYFISSQVYFRHLLLEDLHLHTIFHYGTGFGAECDQIYAA